MEDGLMEQDSKNWWWWVAAFAAAVIGLGIWFFTWELPAIWDDVPNNTLSGQFTEVSCVDPDGVCVAPLRAVIVSVSVATAILSAIGVLVWLFYHFYIEPFIKDRRDENGRYFRR